MPVAELTDEEPRKVAELDDHPPVAELSDTPPETDDQRDARFEKLQRAQQVGRESNSMAESRAGLGAAAAEARKNPAAIKDLALGVASLPFSAGTAALDAMVPEEKRKAALKDGGLRGGVEAGRELADKVAPMLIPMGMGSKALSLIFGADTALNLPQAARDAGTIVGDPNKSKAEKMLALGDLGITTTVAAAMLGHGTSRTLTPAQRLAIELDKSTPRLPPAADDAIIRAAQIMPKAAKAAAEAVTKKPEPASPKVAELTDENPTLAPEITAKNPVVAPEAPPAPAPPPAQEVPASPAAVPDEKGGAQAGVAPVEEKLSETGGTPAPAPPAEAAKSPPKKGNTEGYGGDIYGVAERVRDERAAAGQVAPVKSGEGTDAESAVEWGRALLKGGADPEKAMSDFEKNKAVSFDAVSLVRAQGESLAKSTSRIEQNFGTESPEYKMAFKSLSDWDARSKKMQTEWHKIGMAQQGETDIDTGTFTGLARAHKESTGKDFTPKQAKQAKDIAAKNQRAEADAKAAQEKLFKEADAPVDPKVKSIVERVLAASHSAADAARARLKARAFTFSAGLDPTVLADVAIIGADHILTGATEFASWSKKMIDEFGEKITPHLNEIFNASDAKSYEITGKIAGKEAPKVKEAVKPKAVPTVEEAQKILADHKKGSPWKPEEVKALWQRAKVYIEKGADNFDDIRSKLATDLGFPVEEVTKGMTQPRPVKRMADDVWRKQQTARRVNQEAKNWLKSITLPGWRKAIGAIPRLMFSAKVGFHGTVALGTHAPMVAFQPPFWAAYVRDFGKMYKMVGSPAYYEMQVQDLVRRKNYTKARRAGLVNDPTSMEEYSNPKMDNYLSPKLAEYFDKLTGMGNRGYSVLKILRQDMFDQQWNQLPETAQIPEVASALADGINHATGVVKSKPFNGASTVLFAPRLEMSRAAWLAVDPLKAAGIFTDWKTATEAQKQFAIKQVKEKAWVAVTLFGLLAMNQGVLTATNSKQKINFTDPMKGDFLKFKAAGMDISYGNAMITMARLPVRMFAIRQSNGGKLKNLIYPDEDSYTVLGEYARSQLSPFASLTTDLWLKSDWMKRQLPNSSRPEPKRLLSKGVKPYTWPEFWSEEVLPIPAEEAVREVWKTGLGMSDEQIKQMRKALATIAVMSATGARLTDDWDEKK